MRRDDGFMRRGVRSWGGGHWEAHLHPRVAWRLMNEVWGVRRSPDVLTIREFEALKLIAGVGITRKLQRSYT
ncbi:hypothetical protein [Roseiflexus sp.]